MRYRTVAFLILAASFAALTLANAPRHPSQDSQDQTTQDQSKPKMASGGGTIGPGMTAGRQMMDANVTTGSMITHYEAMCETMNKLMGSMTAIENEKDPVTLKSKLAEHRALLEQMHDQVTQYSMMREIGKASRIPPTPQVWK